MKQKIQKLLFELTRNSRLSTKELGKRIKATQQSSSYLQNQLKEKGLIKKSTAIVDNAKLGFTNVLVGMNYLNFNPESQKDILNTLKTNSSVISIEEATQGVDLLVEFSSINLSAFNKSHTDILHNHQDLETSFVFPIIVKHLYYRNYLTRKTEYKDIIISGDREVESFTPNEMTVINVLVDNPDATIISLSQKANLSVKSLVSIKKNLEKNRIIRRYSCTLNHKELNIHKYFLFLKLASDTMQMDKLVRYAKMNRNIITLTKLIGEYHLALQIEELDQNNLIKEIRSEFPIKDYLVVESENTIKESYIPTLTH